MSEKITSYLKKVFTLDLRALSLMRIGIGIVLLMDVLIRATDLKAHYSNIGVLPLDALFRYAWNPWHISIHTISGAWQIQSILFAVAGLFAVFLILGWKTRITTIVCWFLLFSIQNRNPLILQGGDDLLRMTLFWGMFIPWGKFYSLDRYSQEKDQSYHYFSVATAGYMLQVFSVYFFSALLKSSPEWRTEGTAIYYALSLDQIVFPLGKLIYNYPNLLKSMTLMVFYIEMLLPFLLFSPWFTKPLRILAITVLMLLHIGISSTLFVGLFFIIGMVTLFGLFPSSWMDRIDKKFKAIVLRLDFYLKNVRSLLLLNQNPAFITNLSVKKNNLIKESLLLFCIVYSLLWNFQTTHYNNFKIPAAMSWVGNLFRLDQCWGMFAPSVFKDDGWYILEGITADNKIIDLNRNGAPVSYKKPSSVVSLYKNDRWRKYGENYLFVSNNYMRPYYCDFMLQQWNDSHPDKKVVNLRVVYMKEVTLPDYKYSKPVREVLAYTNH